MTTIPKQIFLFWNGPIPDVVECCIQRIHALHDTWSVHVLTEAEETIEGFERLIIQWKSDWVRLCAMQQGGVWLDASCICTKSVDHWVNMLSGEVQGFSCPFAADCLENWAFAAPPGHPLMIRWKQIFGEAIRMGFEEFKSKVPAYVREHEIFGHMPYLTMHACYLIAARETGTRATLTPSCDGPFRYLCVRNWDTLGAVKALMHEPLTNPPPLIKLRGAETRATESLSLEDGSFMSSVCKPFFLVPKRSELLLPSSLVCVVIIAVLLLLRCHQSETGRTRKAKSR